MATKLVRLPRCAASTMLALAVVLGGCAYDPDAAPPGTIGWNKSTGGALLGAGAGALVANQFGGGAGKAVMTLAGTLLGGFLGHQVGESLDRSDAETAHRAAEPAFARAPSGTAVNWMNPDTGHSGTVVPGKRVRGAAGEECREYQQTVVVGGQTEDAYGTACRQPDGSWRIVS